MKKHLLLWTFFWVNIQLVFAHNFTLTGNIGTDTATIVYLTHYSKNYFEPPILKKAKVENGKFILKCSLEKLTEAQLRVGKLDVAMLIQPNDSLHFELKGMGEEKSIKWTGTGAANNLFFLHYIAFSVQLSNTIKQSESFLSGNANSYRDLLMKDKEKRIDFVKNYTSTELGAPDNLTKNWVNNSIHYQMARALIEYPRLYRKLNSKGKKLKLTEEYYTFIGQVSFGRADLLSEEYYRNFITIWMQEYLVPKFKNENLYVNIKETFELAEKKLIPPDKAFLQYQLLRRGILRSPFPKTYQSQFKKFMKGAAPKGAKKELQKIWDEQLFDHEDTLAPNFKFLNSKGEVVQLHDFKGKVLYVDFWATWCRPCIRSFPHSYQLQERLKKKKDLTFLYISIDKDKNRWLSWVKKNGHKSNGYHVLAIRDEYQNVSKFWNIKSIPHWMIIDHNSVVVNYNARHPGMDATESSLRRYLRKMEK